MGKLEAYYDQCEELYVVQGKTLVAIQQETGVSQPTLKKWKDDGEWDRKREEFLKQNESLTSKLSRLKHALIDDALETRNSQTVYALAMLMKSDNAVGLIKEENPEDLPKEISPETLRKVKEEIYGIIDKNVE